MDSTRDADDVIALLLHMAEFGSTITSALEAVTDVPELARNSSLLTLSILHLEGPQRPHVLQSRTALTSGGVTKLLERLEGQGSVERRSGMVPEDGRAVVVTITDAGRAQLRDLARQFGDHMEQVESFVREATEMVAVLRRLGAAEGS